MDRRQNNSMLRQCPSGIAQQPPHHAIAVPTAVQNSVTKTKSIAPPLGITDDRDVNHFYWATLLSANMLSSRRAVVGVGAGMGWGTGVGLVLMYMFVGHCFYYYKCIYYTVYLFKQCLY